MLVSLSIPILANNPIIDLYQVGGFKFGSFKLKSGLISPFYINLRPIISVPHLLKGVSHLIAQKASELSYDCICGVPLAALSLATLVAYENEKPLVMYRKESKDHGIPTSIEGIFNSGDVCIIVEDIITSGESILGTITAAEKAGLIVHDVIVFIDRKQGGVEHLMERGYKVHAIYTIDQVLEILHNANFIDQSCMSSTREWLANHQT